MKTSNDIKKELIEYGKLCGIKNLHQVFPATCLQDLAII